MTEARTALSLQGVTKTFPGVVALRDVSLGVHVGEVHALVGGNGAGKSTLMAIAAGSLVGDTGSVTIRGMVAAPADPVQARRLGLSIVRQDPALLPDLTVAENMYLAVRPRLPRGVAGANAWAAEALRDWNIDIDPGARIADISVHRRYIVEIASALALRPTVLILDEPTEHLMASEIDQLFGFVHGACARGGAVVYISHRIPEVQRIADRITVLRDGRTMGTFQSGEVSEDEIVRLIVGREVDTVFPPKLRAGGTNGAAPFFVVSDLSGDRFNGVSLDVHPGEVVGLAGVEGNGQREFLRALAGMSPARGSIVLDGRSIRANDPTTSRAAGVAYLPQDRQNDALLLSMAVRENISIAALSRFASLGVIRRGDEAAGVADQIRALAIKTPSPETQVRSLSGGNQQKAMLARNALSEPRVLLAEEPTQGVDAGSRVEIYRILRERAAAGAGIVVLSTDEIELEGLCDRVLIFSRGRVVRELAGTGVTEHGIQQAALTATGSREREDALRELRTPRLSRFFQGDYGPSAILGLVILALAAVATIANPAYLTERNFNGALQLLAALILVSIAQLIVLLTGGIDLSVGPLMGFLVIVASFFIVDKPDPLIGMSGPQGLFVGMVSVVVVALAVGLANGWLIRKARIPAVVATLAVYFGLQGLSLSLRPTPGGLIQRDLTELIEARIGFVPIAFLLAVGLALSLEYGLRRTTWGLELRAVGSREASAARLGIRVDRTHARAYVLTALVVALAAVMLMAQIGIGDANSGPSYTLTSVTAVVLGGASIFGGRGSFVGVILGAAAIQQVNTVTSFLRLDSSATFLLLGLLTLVAAAIYSTARERGTST